MKMSQFDFKQSTNSDKLQPPYPQAPFNSRNVFIHFTLYLCTTNCRSYQSFLGPYSVKESM